LTPGGQRQYNELNGGDKESSYSNQRDFTQKFGLDLLCSKAELIRNKFITSTFNNLLIFL